MGDVVLKHHPFPQAFITTLQGVMEVIGIGMDQRGQPDMPGTQQDQQEQDHDICGPAFHRLWTPMLQHPRRSRTL